MKKLTTSVLAIVLTSSFFVANAQQRKGDTLKTQSIEEVIVTGALGIKRKADAVTTSQQVVGNQELTQAANPNAVSALAGKVAGLQITQTNTSVTGTNSIVIRGNRSFTGSSEALIVIDNVISSATVFQQLPPEVIETVNVIKGAAGAALYGSQGVNGAIIVTTKRGGTNKRMTATFNSVVDFDKVAFLPERQRQYGQGWYGDKISVENGAWGAAFDDPKFAGVLVPYGPSFTDVDGDGYIAYNQDDSNFTADDAGAIHSRYAPYGKNNIRDFFQTGTTYQNTLTVNAGNSDGYVLMSLGSVDREFVVQDDTMKRISGMFKGGVKVGKWRFDGTVNYIRQKTSTTNSNLYSNLLQSSSDIPITLFRDHPDRGYAWSAFYASPYFTMKHERYNTLSNYFNVLASTEFQLNDHINFLYRGNLQFRSTESDSHNDGWSDPRYQKDLDDIQEQGSITAIQSFYNKSTQNYTTYYGDFLVNFDYDLTKDINMKLNVGHNYQEWRTNTVSAGGTGIITPGIYQIWNLSNPTLPINLNNNSFYNNQHAFLANVDLAYKDYLFLNGAGRYEMSSILPMGNRGYFFPAVSASFIPTKAFPSIKGKILNYAKVTAAFQRTGITSNIGVYGVQNLAVVGSGYPYDNTGISFVVNQSQTFKDIKPEFNTKKEVGLTLGFLNDRITLDASAYREDTKDLITNVTTSTASGIVTNLLNIGKLHNKGIDAAINVVPIKSKDFRWDIGVNYTTYKTIVDKVTDDADEVRLAGNNFVGLYAVKGQEFPIIKGTAYVRDDQGRVIVNPTTGLPTVTSTQQVLGKATPKYILGLTTSIKYKGLRVSAVMDYRTGHQFYSGTLQGMTFNGMNPASAGFDRNQPYIVPNSVYLSNGVYVPNTSVAIYNNTGDTPVEKLINYFGGSAYNTVGENYILDATAFKVREIAISYSFGKELLGASKINELTIGVHARNPFYKFSKENRGYDDPETAFDPRYRGLANPDQYPNLKTYGASVTVSF
ncbi:SusC/RagA family TonB-linked outer membrane protein [Chryseobacterium sp. LAM-KRS1]|uniref:SusC/RagA family TonB-linked outer membrane protein n=1 Tax=Chryseobacterium sp. LAM-KRS1 TaxID=2715754 RepID=UPI001552BEC2|nr:SusC/RagA family TonB-linked outer membrane protein [Chryseobacterium sp. LAM-KRS1]